MFLASGTPVEDLVDIATVFSVIGYLSLLLSIGAWMNTAYRATRIRPDRTSVAWSLGSALVLTGFTGVAGVAARTTAQAEPADPQIVPDPSPAIADPAPAPTPQVTAPTGGEGIDVGSLLVGAGALAIVTASAVLVYTLRTRARDRAEARLDREHDWARAQAIHLAVLDDYAAYLADPYAWLDRPALEDVRVEATAAFFTALDNAETLHLDRVPADPQRIEAFGKAAQAMRTAWDEADRHARIVGTSAFADADRARLRRATGALRTALDGAASDGERATALAALTRLTDGLVPVPDRIRTASAAAAALPCPDRRALPVGRGR